MKSIALFDLDKTLYNRHSFFEIVKDEIDNGVLAQSLWQDIQHQLTLYKAGTQDYSTTAKKLLDIWVGALKGKDYNEISRLTAQYFSNNKANFYPYFEKILPKLKETHDVYIVTTNAQFVAEAVVDMYKLDGFISTFFEVENEKFTGEISRSLADGKTLVKELITPDNFKRSIACGDSANDILMLKEVSIGVCINADEELKNAALENNWIITTPENAEQDFIKILEKQE